MKRGIDIGRRLKMALPKLTKGVGGVTAPLLTALFDEGEWTADFAVIKGALPDPKESERPYFDFAHWKRDFAAKLGKLFTEGGRWPVFVARYDSIKVTDAVPKKKVFARWLKPGMIVIRDFENFESGEVMIYRTRHDLPRIGEVR